MNPEGRGHKRIYSICYFLSFIYNEDRHVAITARSAVNATLRGASPLSDQRRAPVREEATGRRTRQVDTANRQRAGERFNGEPYRNATPRRQAQ